MNSQQLVRAHGQWLRKYDWQGFATMTFPRPVGQKYALDRVQTFLDDFNAPAFAVIVAEKGPAGQLWHAHALIGGLHQGGVMCVRGAWERRVGGSIKWSLYDSRQGATYYISKSFFRDPDSVVYYGDPENRRRAYPRKRGRRGQGARRRARVEARAASALEHLT